MYNAKSPRASENGTGERAPGGGSLFRSIAGNLFFMITISLGFISWAIVLVSQAIVSSDFGNSPVGVLWFAFAVQTFLIPGVVYALHTSTIVIHHTQLAIFAALVTVYAVVGVERNVFATTNSQNALAAGWLITAFVDILWILYFSSEPHTPVPRFLASFGRGTGKVDERPTSTPIPNVPRSIDAFSQQQQGYLPRSGGPTERGSRVLSGEGTPSRGPTASGAGDLEMQMQTRRSPRESGTYSRAGEKERESAGTLLSRERGGGTGGATSPAGTGAGTAAGARSAARPDSGATIPETPEPGLYRAEALFPYDGRKSEDPNEISFAKGEVMEVVDKSGKWWEVKKQDGTKGIAPSNYLQLL